MAQAVLLWAPKWQTRVSLPRPRVGRSGTLIIKPGRNTEAELLANMVATDEVKELLAGDLIGALLELPSVQRMLKAGKLKVQRETIRKAAPPRPPAPRTTTPSREEELERALAEGTEPELGETPIPWSKRDKVEDLARALLSREVDAEGMTKAEMLEALEAWDATNLGEEDEPEEGDEG